MRHVTVGELGDPTRHVRGGLHDPAAGEFGQLEPAALFNELRAQRAQCREHELGVLVDDVGELFGGDGFERHRQHRFEFLFE